MQRSASRRVDARNIGRGALPPGKAPYGEPTPSVETSQRSDKPSKRSRPLSSSTNKEVPGLQADSATPLSSIASQWKLGRSSIAGTPDENDDWILNQQAPPLPSLTDRPRSRTRTSSAGGSKTKVKSEQKKSRAFLSQDDTALVTHAGHGDQVVRKHRRNTDAGRQSPGTDLQENTLSLKRRTSWGRNKKAAQNLTSQDSGYKRTSQVGLLESEITSAQRAHSTQNFPSMLSPPTVYERPGSSLSLPSTSPLLRETISAEPRRRTHSSRSQSYRDEGTGVDNGSAIYRKRMDTMTVEDGQDTFTKAAKANSDRMPSLKTPRAAKTYKSLTPNMDADDSGSEPAVRTPRARSSSKSRVSPFLPSTASPTRTPSSIPTPKFLSRSSTSGTHVDKSPNMVQSSAHGTSRTTSSSRSPAFRSVQGESVSCSRRPSYVSDKPKVGSKLSSPRAPSMNTDEDADGTPKASRIALKRVYQSSTDSDGTSDEKLYVINHHGSSHLRSHPSSSRCSPVPAYTGKPRGLPVSRPSNSVHTRDGLSGSDFSEREVTQIAKPREDSLLRRKNELADLVAGLNLKLGPQSNRRNSLTSRRHSGLHSRDQSEYLSGEDAVGIAMGGSSETVGFQRSPQLPNEVSARRKGPDVSSRARQDINGPTTAAVQTNDLLKPNYRESNRYSLLMLNADRQREAFGIPPSTSITREGSVMLSSGESNTSLRNQTLDSECEGEANDGLGLSHGAAKLFDALGIGADAQQSDVQASKQWVSWRTSMAEAEKYLLENMRPAPAAISASSSTSSIYEDDVPERPWQKRERDLDRIQCVSGSSVKSSWKKTLSNSAYVSLLERHGETEMRRQEVIWELCETEQAFLKSLRTALKVFVNPLLGRNRTWASGVPSKISRLLDWLEDIYQLHAKISSALQHARSAQYPVILRIAEALRIFVPKLEVYQPYIVRLDEVVENIESIMNDPNNQLGEFFRIQSSNDECSGMSFTSFLWLPLTRLGRYLKHFNELWSLTPRSHVDHLPTFSLLHSATMVVRVMREVKLREEEYGFVKELLSRVKGFPNLASLVRRERRLIAHGTLQRIHAGERTRDMLEGNCSTSVNSRNEIRRGYPHRSAKPMHTRQRANSLDSCLSSAVSMSSISSAASNSSLNGEVALQYNIRANGGHNVKSANRGRHFHERGKVTYQEKTRSTSLYAFVFTDLAVFASTSHSSKDARLQNTLELLDDIGICRVLSVADHSGDLGYDHLIGVHVLPVDIEQLDNGILSDASTTCLFVHLPSADSSAPQYLDARIRWWSAFERCYHFTLRSLSFPAHSGKYLACRPGAEQDENTRQTVMSILASGLPLPKSPSAQIGELEKSAAEDASQREREERGWWAVRFQQILHEVQGNDIPLLPQGVCTVSSPSPRRKTVSARRRLKLASGRK